MEPTYQIASANLAVGVVCFSPKPVMTSEEALGSSENEATR